jgi:hypothetical protein
MSLTLRARRPALASQKARIQYGSGRTPRIEIAEPALEVAPGQLPEL